MSVTVICDGKRCDTASLQYTSVDPGGFETCTFGLEAGPAPRPGAEVLVLDGLEVAWHGMVEEPGQRHQQGRAAANVSAVGYGAALKRNAYPMIYMDRSTQRWQNAGRQRILDLIAATVTQHAPAVTQDPTTGEPA